MTRKQLAAAQMTTLVEWLHAFDVRPAKTIRSRRRLRVRAAVLDALETLGRAYARHDAGAEADVAMLTAVIRRWLGVQTFAVHTGQSGLQLVDARAARYGDFDELHLAGLIDGEWPQRPRRNVLYPASSWLLAAQPGIPNREREALDGAARAAFRRFTGPGATTCAVSTVRSNTTPWSNRRCSWTRWPLAPPCRGAARGARRVSSRDALSLEPRAGCGPARIAWLGRGASVAPVGARCASTARPARGGCHGCR